MKTVFAIVGTRPEAIKMYPVIKELKNSNLNTVVIHTGQHKDMLDIHIKELNITVDVYLDAVGSTMVEVMNNIVANLEIQVQKYNPHCIIAQGDTNSVYSAAIVSFYNQIPFAHIEAGLRSGDVNSPFPEEMNRILSDRLSSMMFCPTKEAVQNLLNEGLDEKHIFLVGNTVVDTIIEMTQGVQINNDNSFNILATMHRRENHGENLVKFCKALKELAQNDKIKILFPVHQNPNVWNVVYSELASISNITLTKPIEYKPFLHAMVNADLILTDSGGVQEEVATLGKKAFILRKNTERKETLNTNIQMLGNETNNIVDKVKTFYNSYKKSLLNTIEYHCVFGYGESSKKIVNIIKETI